MIVEGQTGWLVPPADPVALADRIVLALADGARRREMGEAGRRRVREEWTFAAQAEKYQQLFERLLGTGVRHQESGGRVHEPGIRSQEPVNSSAPSVPSVP